MKKEFQFGDALHELTNKKRKKMRGIVNHAAANSDRYNSILESPEYAEEYNKLVKRVLPLIDVKNPETFAFYGSAEKYYENSYSYIYGSYPYDGSALEKVKWSLSASVLDLAVLQHEYPKEVGLVNLSPTGWGTVSSTAGNYGLPAIPEYIKFSGGPYVGTRLDSATNRESGLKLDPSAGNTVEFWLKKGSYASTKTGREVITDIGTSDYTEGSSSYGRFLVEMSTSAGSANPILLTYMSGTAGFDGAQFTLSDITKETIADDSYHHYAITVYSSGSNLVAELYFDGEYDSTISTTEALGPVLGYFNGTIGALSQAKDGNGVMGSGKAIGSIDDFRFWKEKRTPEQIGLYYDSPVNGATDKENINNILGVYYKFNEGTTDNTSQDKIILDYSGRVNNGEFIGYNADSRSNVSAITLTSTTTEREIGDPIINSTSSRVVTQLAKLTNVGRAYDRYNNSSLFKSVPQWAYDTPAGSNNLESDFSILIQAMASQFDSIRLLINDIPKISFPQYRDFFYASGSANYSQNFTSLLGCEKDFTNTYNTFGGEEKYVIQNLVGRGFDVTDLPIVSRSSLDEFFHNLKFEKIDQKTLVAPALIYSKADTIKNKILNSVYVNLQSIYGTKGTTSSFRNLIRCFGVDEKLIAPNVYANNAEKEIKNEAVSHDIEIKSISFQDLNREVTLHQAADTAEERDYIAGRPSGPMTFETTAYFPYITPSTSTATTANIFGVRGVSGADLATTVANYPGFVVQSIKSATINPGAYFKLSSKSGIFTDLTTSYFNEVYANKPWHLAVRFSEDTDNPLYNTNNRTDKTYRVEFSGYQYELDVLTAQFNMSASINSTNYQNFITSNKSVFAGAERTNIVGSVQTISDLKNISLSVWDDRLETEEIKEHAKEIDTIGRTLAMSRKDSNEGSSVLRGDSLILNWQFDDVTYNSDTIQIEDHASGSAESLSRYGSITGYKYPAVTTTVPDMTGIIQQEFLSALKYINIDNFYSKSKVEIKDREIESFQLDSRPVSSLYTYEKSMYQVLSAEMLKMLAGAVAFNNLIGQPVYKYRQEYKSLEKLRERFFSKVEGKVDLEKFIEYYKWIDSSLGKMLQQLQPATAEMNLGLEDVVESHALERNKYQHKTPNFEFKDPKIEGQILAINELLYDWEHGHAPLSLDEADNCLWWSDRAERDGILSVSSNTDSDRETQRIRRSSVVSGSTYALRRLTRPYSLTSARLPVIEVGSNRNASKNKSFYKIINSGHEIKLNKSDIYEFKKCSDVLNPQKENIYTAKTNTTNTEGYLDADADMILPFSLYSSSAGQDFSDFKSNLSITNNHDDERGSLQGPFARDNVGGMPHRRVRLGAVYKDRPEAYILSATAETLTLKENKGPFVGPRSTVSRGLQRPYNIANINTDLTSGLAGREGNYEKDYEIVMTTGRRLNNGYLADSGSVIIDPVSTSQIGGLIDFTTPVRGRREHVIVNQFSSPGGPETQGAYGRDKESAEYSVYNTLNYRNLSIRNPLNLLEKERALTQGYRSGSTTQASMHMTNRNYFYSTSSTAQVSKADNAFIQHPIPQNDFGYSWITASATNTKFDFVNKNLGLGHQHDYASGSASSISFLSQSLYGSFHYRVGPSIPSFIIYSGRVFGTLGSRVFDSIEEYPELFDFKSFVPVDFLNLNTIIQEPVNTEANTLGYDSLEYTDASGNIVSAYDGGTYTTFTQANIKDSNYINQTFVGGIPGYYYGETGAGGEGTVTGFGDGLATLLNSIILNRQGPYGWPSWKQLRGGEHPIVRAHRRSSTFSRVYEGNLSTGAIVASQRTPSMNYGASRFPTISDVYERSLLLNNNDKYAAGTSTGRIIKNYIDPIATNRFCPISITIHGVHAPTSPLGSDSMEWTRGQDPRLPHFYKERENVRKLKERERELAWNLDHYYYEYLTQVAEAGREDVNLEHLGQYLPAFGNVNIRKTYQNDLTSYANMEIAEDTNHNEIKHHDFIPFMKNIIAENMLGQNKLLEISYIEKIYPREESTYKKSVREREKFDFHGWKSSRSSRENILVGNITYSNSALLNSTDLQAFKTITAADQSDYRSSFLGSFDAVDLLGAQEALLHITASTWSLDGRSDFTLRPVEIGNSYFNSGSSALTSRDQGTRGEGILQNDFSTFPLGYNSLHGTPPFSLVYNRRIPQTVGAPRSADLSRNTSAPTYLAGEAKWEAASSSLGPFYDSYEKYSEDIKFIAQDHSLVPEFRISEFAEDILTGERGYPNIGDDYLAITGAIYQNSSGEVEAGGQFFKTYSNSDFLKYFSVVDEELREGQYPISHARMTLKCKAAMKFLPYRGFYPAERSVQLAELFQRNYLGANTLTSEHIQVDKGSDIPENDVREYVKLRANASRFNAGKAFFGPGILYNSIKSGVAVDYPIFQTHLTSALTELPETVPIQSYTDLYIHATSSFTGSLINGTVDGGIPRLKSNVTKRISFEDVLNPVNIYDTEMHDNEPHPSASLLYGTTAWNKIIERPSLFGKFNEKDMEFRLGAKFTNPRNAFAVQISPYTLAVQNFAAETANFFLEDGHLTTAMSKPVKEFFKEGSTYTMRAHITNVDTTMYDRHSAFGPPVDDGHGGVALTVLTPATNLDLPAPIGARADTTFGNPSGYDLSSVTGSEHMPKLVLTSESGVESTFAFYDSDNSKGSFSHLNTPKFNYIDTKTSAPDIADQFYSRLKKINDDDRGYKPSSFSSASVGVLSTILGPSGSISSIRTDFGITAETNTLYCIGQSPQTSGSVFSTTSPDHNMKLHDPAGWVPWLMQATASAQLPSIQYTVGATTHTFKFYATSSINTPWASNTTFITASLRANSRDTAAVNLCHSINAVSGFGITATAGTNGLGEINTVLVGTSTGVVPTLSNGSVQATPVFIFDEIMNNHNIQLTGGVVAHTASYETTQTTSVTEHGFAPYVPPFLDKNADPYVEISFVPSASRVYGAKEIIENSTFTYHNFHTAPSNAGTNQNYINSMSLSASLNLGICVKLEADNVETVLHGSGYLSNDDQPAEVGLPVAPVRIDPNHDFYRWVIQTKWETPVLDFTNVTASALTIAGDVLPVSGSPWKTRTWDAYYHRGQENSAATAGSFITGSIGMWHQKGTFPGMDNTNAGTNKNKGYFLNIVDVPTAEGSHGLAGKLGFSIDREKNINQRGIKEAKLYRQRIGAIEDKKVIKEAIVAIPYIIRTDLRNEIQFVEFNEDFYDKAKNTVAAIKKEIRDVSISDRINTIEEYERLRAKYAVRTGNLISDSPVNAIEYQLFMMEEYILPPDLDFLMSGKTPYMMYFFQFKASLGKDDLGNMWQNLYPSSADSTATARYSYTNKSFEGRFGFENDVSYVSHYLDTLSLMGDSLSPVENPRNLFSPLDKNQNTRWMIFKVKQRGLTSLEEVRKRSIDPRTSNIQEMEYLKGSQSSLSQGSLYSGLPGRGRPINKLQFNWPYDYFSFVELVKLETKIDSYNHIPPAGAPGPINAPVVGNIPGSINAPGSKIEE